MVATYEDERRFLSALTQTKGPFLLIGFDESEQKYLLECVRECLKRTGYYLSLDELIDASQPRSIEKATSASCGLFDATGWQVISHVEIVKKEHVQPWIEAISQSSLHTLILLDKKLDKAWQVMLEEATILDVMGEKPWDKPKRLAPWLQAFVKSMGMEVTFFDACQLCESLRCDRQMIKTQAQALGAVHGYQGKMQINALSLESNLQLWKWIEYLFKGDKKRALSSIDTLLAEDPTAIPLLAFLRNQWHGALELAGAGRREEAVTGAAKRQQLAVDRFGSDMLCEGARIIAKAQLDLKSSRDPHEVLQALILRLSRLQRKELACV